MGEVITHMTMSLDGFIADSQDGVGELFEWYEAGEVEMSTANPEVTFRVDRASAEMLERLRGRAGALVAGRHLFNITNGWHDKHPVGVPVVVVTHRPPTDASQKWPKTSFINGVEPAIVRARGIARDKNVIVSSPTIIQQALNAGLVDQVWISRGGPKCRFA